jgi:hypothetical protein
LQQCSNGPTSDNQHPTLRSILSFDWGSFGIRASMKPLDGQLRETNYWKVTCPASLNTAGDDTVGRMRVEGISYANDFPACVSISNQEGAEIDLPPNMRSTRRWKQMTLVSLNKAWRSKIL